LKILFVNSAFEQGSALQSICQSIIRSLDSSRNAPAHPSRSQVEYASALSLILRLSF
jgi:hypothetical protein